MYSDLRLEVWFVRKVLYLHLLLPSLILYLHLLNQFRTGLVRRVISRTSCHPFSFSRRMVVLLGFEGLDFFAEYPYVHTRFIVLYFDMFTYSFINLFVRGYSSKVVSLQVGGLLFFPFVHIE